MDFGEQIMSIRLENNLTRNKCQQAQCDPAGCF